MVARRAVQDQEHCRQDFRQLLLSQVLWLARINDPLLRDRHDLLKLEEIFKSAGTLAGLLDPRSPSVLSVKRIGISMMFEDILAGLSCKVIETELV